MLGAIRIGAVVMPAPNMLTPRDIGRGYGANPVPLFVSCHRVTCGGTSGPMVETDVRRMFWNQWSLLGSTMGNDAEFDAIVSELRAGRLIPPVDSVHELEQGRAAFERLASGEQFGKVVVRVS